MGFGFVLWLRFDSFSLAGRVARFHHGHGEDDGERLRIVGSRVVCGWYIKGHDVPIPGVSEVETL